VAWNWKHPNIQDSFYLKIEAPKNTDDARIKMTCHQHAVNDFELQISMNEMEVSRLKENDDVLPYHLDKVDELEEKKLKLFLGKRFHQNATNAYWFWLAKTGK
jgi:hypothetical protein